MSTLLTRRSLLKSAIVIAVAAPLAQACAPKAAAPTAAPAAPVAKKQEPAAPAPKAKTPLSIATYAGAGNEWQRVMARAWQAEHAEVELTSRSGTRYVPMEAFIVGVRKTVRRPDELITAIRFPVPPANSASAFHKVGLRKADAISVLSVAVWVERDAAGVCRKARIALGSVAPTPIRVRAAEDCLTGQPLTPALIQEAASLAAEAARPIDDLRGSAAYRQRVVEVVTRRLLIAVVGQVREG